jgi:hypothetical protein
LLDMELVPKWQVMRSAGSSCDLGQWSAMFVKALRNITVSSWLLIIGKDVPMLLNRPEQFILQGLNFRSRRA